MDEVDLARALARQLGLPFARAEALLEVADPASVSALTLSEVERQHLVPLAWRDGTLVAATTTPDGRLNDLCQRLGLRVFDVRLVTPTDMARLRSSLALGATPVPATTAPPRPATDAVDLAAADVGRPDARYRALFDALMLEAVGREASDVHLERYGDRVRARLRVDGDLRDHPRLDLTPADHLGLVNVIKIRADLDISERRLPQGGRDSVRVAGQTYNLRVQTQPSLYGEHVVIRLLRDRPRLLTIEELGFPASAAAGYRRLLDSPNGLVLVVGPTGSGKTTTLYAGLQILARDRTRKVITVEDPIEYALDGVQQTQVRPDIGFAFADAMRAFVRQDPDVILVGEIRDAETALEAVRASQTGHIVLSTLHCNDAVDAVQRLLDLGLHPNSLASELLAVVAQRLARRLCVHCRHQDVPDPALMAEVFPGGAPRDFRVYAGSGCARCDGEGRKGRVGLVEYLRTGPHLRRAIARRLPLDDLRALAWTSGLLPMREHALALVQEGVIGFGDLPAVLSVEQLAPPPRTASPAPPA